MRIRFLPSVNFFELFTVDSEFDRQAIGVNYVQRGAVTVINRSKIYAVFVKSFSDCSLIQCIRI